MSQRLEIGQDAGRIARLAEDVQILGRPRYAGMASQRIGARQHEGDAGLDQMRKAFGIEFRRVRWRIEGGGFAVHPQGNGQAGASVPPSVSAGLFHRREDRKSVVYGKRVSVRVDIGGRSIIKKKKKNKCIDYIT